jgi:hypothetical protein
LEAGDVIVDLLYIDQGAKDANPVDKMRFYTKDNAVEAVKMKKEDVSRMLPPCFAEQEIRVFSKKRDSKSVLIVRSAFNAWCTENSCIPPVGEMLAIQATPRKQTRGGGARHPTDGASTRMAAAGKKPVFKLTAC